MCKVSIIISAYNIENYIERCILSCMNQTFENIEIIVVNDGSTDDTLKIINKLKSKDNRIIVIDKNNEGLMESRKSGWNLSKGEYILFVDGDDYIDENTVKVLYEKAKEENYDIVCYKFLVEDISGNIKNGWDSQIRINNNERMLDLLFLGKVNHSIWSKLIRKNFIIDNEIDFPNDISYGEDLAFVYTLSMYNPYFTIIDEYLYHYCRREDSLDSNINIKTCEIMNALIFIKQQLIKNNIYKKYKEEFEYMAYKQSYYIRKEYIFNNNNEISRCLFDNWKNLEIKINYKNNRFYRKLYESDNIKTLILEEICKRSYYMGKLYYKLNYNKNFKE